MHGKFIVFDGPDGCGKGTQIARTQAALETDSVNVTLAKDPGGTVIGDQIRHILLNSGHTQKRMDVCCETLLFMASRAQLVGEVIEPALKQNHCVLCDRFISSTLAYQGAGGYPMEKIMALGRYAVGETWPHATVILNVPFEVGLARVKRKPGTRNTSQGVLFKDASLDSMESRTKSFHEKVHRLFLNLPADYPGKVCVVDGTGTPEEVQLRVTEALGDVLGSD